MKYFVNEERKENQLEVYLVFNGEKSENEYVNKLIDNKVFSTKSVNAYVQRDLGSNLAIALVSLGNKDKVCFDTIRLAFFKLGKELESKKENYANIKVNKINDLCTKRTLMAAYEGLIQSTYVWDRYKTDKLERQELNINFLVDPAKEEKVKEGLFEISNVLEGVFLTRDLVNTPAQDLYPETLANIAKEKLEKNGVKVRIYDEKEIEKIGMKAFLSVARGSAKKPRLIVMEYLNDDTSNEKIALVGKGVTYDTGGYSIKPNDGMKTMFGDMGGSGTVIGTMYAISKNKVKANVVAVVAACENAIDGNAYKPGDVISSLSGKTIEVDNTDAEGRLTLADALYYAINNENATKVIDLATLTGACVVALGEYTTGAVTNCCKLFDEVNEAANKCGEYICKLPNNESYKKLNDSLVADIKNSGGRLGGAITAGLFIGEFNNKNIPWLHLDIAGTAFLSSPFKYLPKAATGIHVKTLHEYLKTKSCSCGCNLSK